MGVRNLNARRWRAINVKNLVSQCAPSKETPTTYYRYHTIYN
jgi:hypothetical protein